MALIRFGWFFHGPTLNYICWDGISLQIKFLKDFIDPTRVAAVPNTHHYVAFFTKCQLVAFHAATTNRSDIFTSDTAHRVLSPGMLQSFARFKSLVLLIQTFFSLVFPLYTSLNKNFHG